MTTRTIKPEDVLSLRFVRDAQLSPDGSMAAISVSRTDQQADAEYCEVWIQDIASGKRLEVATGAIYASAPRWAPDGRHLAYAVRGKEGTRVFAYLLDSGESLPLTPANMSIAGPISWSPDGARFVAVVAVFKPSGPVLRITKRVFRSEGIGLLSELEQKLCVFDAAGGEPVQLMSGERYLYPKWSPAGDRILVLAAGAEAAAGSGGSPRPRIINVATKEVFEFSEKWFAQEACWSANGRVVIAGVFNTADAVPTPTLWIADADDTNRELRTTHDVPCVGVRAHHDMPMWDLTLGVSAFVPGHEAAYVTAQVGGRVEIWRVGLSGSLACERVIGGDRACLLLSACPRNRGLLYMTSSMFDPSELFFARWDEPSREQRLTHLNDDIVCRWPDFRVEHLKFRSQDGLAIEGWFMARAGARGPQPTVMYIHGGPFLAVGYMFRFDLVMLAANGYGVLFSNFRGSVGYGPEHTRAVSGDWGARGFPDHMSTVDTAIGRGLADADRLGVWGASHGGFATCWIVGHTQRFKAAVAEAAVSNFETIYYLADAPDGFTVDLGGKPQEIPDVYRSRSPITYAHRCRTPTLMLHGMDDLRCTLAEAEQFYRALLDNGCISEMVLLKGCDHMGDSMGPLSARVGQNEALLDWFERYL